MTVVYVIFHCITLTVHTSQTCCIIDNDEYMYMCMLFELWVAGIQIVLARGCEAFMGCIDM